MLKLLYILMLATEIPKKSWLNFLQITLIKLLKFYNFLVAMLAFFTLLTFHKQFKKTLLLLHHYSVQTLLNVKIRLTCLQRTMVCNDYLYYQKAMIKSCSLLHNLGYPANGCQLQKNNFFRFLTSCHSRFG